jgi:hypothetical protein
VTAEIDLAAGGEPAEPEPVRPPDQKSGLGEVHLGGHEPHPFRVPCGREQTDGGGIAAEGPIGERVHLDEWLFRHGVLEEGWVRRGRK